MWYAYPSVTVLSYIKQISPGKWRYYHPEIRTQYLISENLPTRESKVIESLLKLDIGRALPV